SWSREIFYIFLFVMGFFSYLLVPILSATSINREFERKTWEMLRSTHLNTASIILAKLLSSIFILIIMILSTIPFIGIMQTIGKIAPQELIITMLILIEGI